MWPAPKCAANQAQQTVVWGKENWGNWPEHKALFLLGHTTRAIPQLLVHLPHASHPLHFLFDLQNMDTKRRNKKNEWVRWSSVSPLLGLSYIQVWKLKFTESWRKNGKEWHASNTTKANLRTCFADIPWWFPSGPKCSARERGHLSALTFWSHLCQNKKWEILITNCITRKRSTMDQRVYRLQQKKFEIKCKRA